MALPKRCPEGGTWAGRITHLEGTVRRFAQRLIGLGDKRPSMLPRLYEMLEQEKAELKRTKDLLRNHTFGFTDVDDEGNARTEKDWDGISGCERCQIVLRDVRDGIRL